jgi:hypothetical protein
MKAVFRPLGAALLLLSFATASGAADLRDHTVRAFDSYTKKAEEEMERQVHSQKFLNLDQDPEKLGRARAGEIVIWPPDRNPITVKDGLIHDWTGAVFIPGATLARTLATVKDYDNHKKIYGPEVEDSKLLSNSGNRYKVYLRLRKQKVITVVLNTEYVVDYYPVDGSKVYSKSYSTKIAEVEDPGSPDESEKPAGHDNGFLWKLYSYWRFAERDGGVYFECRAISLTRGIPFGAGWVVEPVVKELPRESLEKTLSASLEKLRK